MAHLIEIFSGFSLGFHEDATSPKDDNMTPPAGQPPRHPESGMVTPDERTLTYDRYLKVPELLALQQVVSRPAEHDETLFIIIHQVYELWFKQIRHELTFAAACIDRGEVMPLLKTFKRVAAIQDVLIQQIDILETMTPEDFNQFRDHLNPASGFQSFQFRTVEFTMGEKDSNYLKFFRTEADALKTLEAALRAPSLYDRFVQLLAKQGFTIDAAVLKRDVSQPWVTNESVRDAVVQIYKKARDHYDLYLTMEAMIDIDEKFLLWRFRHVAMVERMIGARRGTGGSTGVKYLSNTLTKRFFPELWEARNFMGGGSYGASKGES